VGFEKVRRPMKTLIGGRVTFLIGNPEASSA
jgi:hypothetical protein